ncbi:hypothetical protein HJG60_009148 [Phyllostomus discolor]|uniref:Uncharacterized protein n=1 Tax=Phyllostomus discolor TaxID=89673 RepID=A0A833YPZ4_9CHIR|nr:hypothetical protein HJG60_009148 [Phyllostomus discolor]
MGSATRTPPLLRRQRGGCSCVLCLLPWTQVRPPRLDVWLAEVACLRQSRVCGGRDGGLLGPHLWTVTRWQRNWAERQPQVQVTASAEGHCCGLGGLGAKLPSGLGTGTGCHSLDPPPGLPGVPQLAGGVHTSPALPFWPADGLGWSPFLLGKRTCLETGRDLNCQLLSQFFQNFVCGREVHQGGGTLSDAGLGAPRAFPGEISLHEVLGHYLPLPHQLGQEHSSRFQFTVLKQGWRGIPGSKLPNTRAPP